MERPERSPWAKLSRDADGVVIGWHSLTDHSADVAACVEALLDLPVIQRRLARLAGRDKLPAVWRARLSAVAFLHDLGKANSGFQARWDVGAPFVGHIRPVLGLLSDHQELAGRTLPIAEMERWGNGLGEAFNAVLAHHGAPLDDDPTRDAALLRHWRAVPGYDPADGLAQLGRQVTLWFPYAFAPDGPVLPETPQFWHAYAGLVMLADWLGSDTRSFPFADGGVPDRMSFARRRAADVMAEFGLETSRARSTLPDRIDFPAISPYRPTAAQAATADADGPIVVLEAETGAGKTEAALWRFARLFADGTVDGLYFALPTRVAATALFERVRAAVRRMFPDEATRPAVVLAVPGYARVDEAEGRHLPDFQVQWDDTPDAAAGRARWAAEHPKRFLAATVAVGTIDQALLGAIPVKHAHLRAACLMRSLLVVDEVHASDAYMEVLLRSLLDFHLAAGGEALLLSATLGSGARTRLVTGDRRLAPPDLAVAEAAPYPAVWTLAGSKPVVRPTSAGGRIKHVRMTVAPIIGDPTGVATCALALAQQGAKVLVVRNTVGDAVATVAALHALSPDDPALFRCGDVPTLHHGRFAREDRRLLDHAVELAIGRDSADRGLVLVGTQTLEQSLDISADVMLTDLCPADVLLQRLGRLHRHPRAHPPGFEEPICTVLVPPEGTDLATWRGHGLGSEASPYPDRPVVSATRRLIAVHPVWEIPAMNRLLVERSTHLEALDGLGRLDDPLWRKATDEMLGRRLAKAVHGGHARLDWSTPFSDLRFPGDCPAATRLGARDRSIELPKGGLEGPFGARVRTLTIPSHLCPPETEDGDPEATDLAVLDRGFRLRLGSARFEYGAYGLGRC